MRHRLILAAICAVAVIRVASTSHIFCATTDEPGHLANGYAWLTGAPYPRDLLHPPLAQLLAAAPLVIKGTPAPESPADVVAGNELLYSDRNYMRNVELARIGNLLFLIIGTIAVAAWGRRTFDEATGLVAAALWSLLPSLLAHTGVATTDATIIGLLPVSMLALERWIDVPSVRRAIELGVICGIATIGKFSFIPFFIVAAIVALAIRFRSIVWRKHVAGVAIAFVALMLVLWAGYRFSFGTIAKSHANAPTVIALKMSRLRWLAEHVPIPAPQFFTGLGALAIHNTNGQLAYLDGEYSMTGWRRYFPEVLFYKTPMAFWLLFAWGVVAVIRTRRGFVPLAAGIAILLSVMPSHINVGVRHVVPLYAMFAIIAAYGVTTAWSERAVFGRTALATICAWLLLAGAMAHPDYLAYFNEAAGAHPERIAADSNLDWGQDWLRFIRWQARTQPGKVGVVWYGSIDLSRHPVEVYGIPPYTKATGWVVASETAMKLANTTGKDFGEPYRWLETYQPVARIGRGLRVYRIEE